PPQPVDRLVPRGGRDPGAGVVREAPLRPDLHCHQEGLLDRILGEIEVAENADQRGRRASRLAPKDASDQLSRRPHTTGCSSPRLKRPRTQAVASSTRLPASSKTITGRISTEPLCAPGIFAAQSIASSRSLQSRT